MSEEQQKRETQGAPVSRETERSAAPDVSRETRRDKVRSDSERPDGNSSSRPLVPPSPKNKRSSAYLYLVVLFGAAFLMLLLAYFVQQRNNASTINGLQDSWNLSRQELLEENRRLTEKNEELEVRLAALEDQRDRAYRQLDELEAQSEQYKADLEDMAWRCYQLSILSILERCRDTGDWLLMGETVQMNDPFFNREHPDYAGEPLLPAQEAQYLELRAELFEKSGFMVMERRREPDGSESAEFPLISEDAFHEGVIKTAVELYAVIRDSAVDPARAANQITADFGPSSGNMEILHSGVFPASTVEWFEQIKADLAAQGLP